MTRRIRRHIVLGLDLSLRGAGMVALPSDWEGDWKRIARATFGEELTADAPSKARIGRLSRLAAKVVGFAREHGCTFALVEGYAFDRRYGREQLAEFVGIVKHQLAEKLELAPDVVHIQTARKFLLGKVPRKGQKEAVRFFLGRCGMPAAWTMDEGDAFVVANYAMSGIGGYAIGSPQ